VQFPDCDKEKKFMSLFLFYTQTCIPMIDKILCFD
jgi:hypothetical protein